ncbi:MAG: peptidylprolyl isomerase [Phocaeicola sp.]
MNKLNATRLYACLCLLVMALTTSYAQDNVIDEVVWIVGDEAILKSDVENERLNAQYEGRHFDGDPYCVIPEELAVQKLFLHQAEIDSVEVSEQQVIQDVEQRIAWLTEVIGSKERMEEQYNKTSTQIRETMRENVREGLMVQEMQKKIVGDIKLTPSEVRNYFNNLSQDSIPFIPTQVEVQIITREPKVKEEEIERVKKELRDFTERINKGETTFSTLARLYSEDPGSARMGGEYEKFQGRGELTPEFANVVFNLTDTKKISKVFQTEYGFHIAQLIEKRGDRIRYRHILIKPRIDEEEFDTEIHRLDTLANDIRKGKVTFDEAAAWVSQDKKTRNNHGLLANPQSTTSRFEMQQLAGMVSQELAKVVENMQIGEISKPFRMVMVESGKEVCAIVKLKNRIDGHKATISEDYQRLKDIVTQKRSEEKLQKWILEKQKKTYVRINPNWRKCDFKYPGWIK